MISHAGGIEAGIVSEEAQREFQIAPDALEKLICRSENLTSTERLGIYGNAYYARLLECLRESFPVLAYALGNDLFDEFSLEYLQRYPSQSYSLCQLGDHFAAHLKETRPDAEQHEEGQVDWPDFLIDLANTRMEYRASIRRARFRGSSSPGLSTDRVDSARELAPDDATPCPLFASSRVPISSQ